MTGAGISAESGIPTFRGAGGYWKKYEAASLATPEAFRKNPRLVWEFYNYRREVAATAKPNMAHIAIAQYEARHKDKNVMVVTQNVDALHVRAGTHHLIELHGNLFKTRCCKCKTVQENYDIPILQVRNRLWLCEAHNWPRVSVGNVARGCGIVDKLQLLFANELGRKSAPTGELLELVPSFPDP
ncbi:NAD-dependent protein deacylase sirtuin-5, mitochondrial [Eumeta japonica]|uniref:NAD-dependent protein deacylase sirtuin-5, mitochondrial n=1 Tax=Eumeta variegata TaxID=151549 RepID=A0A4C1ZAF8_EUMVA|nr:NAD-dependent protein deacylase sirtuin-5, mitochondrial [Eumeta japonica]